MNIANQLSSAQDRRDQDLNFGLAEQIATRRNGYDVKELLALAHTGTRTQKHDAIKVLYEIGRRGPDLIAPHLDAFIDLIAVRDNRMIWGAMTAIAMITHEQPKTVYAHLDQICRAAERGSVIAKDQAVTILVSLMADGDLQDEIAPVLLDHIRLAAINQLPMYADMAMPVLKEKYADDLKTVLMTRLAESMPDSKRRRLEKVVKALSV